MKNLKRSIIELMFASGVFALSMNVQAAPEGHGHDNAHSRHGSAKAPSAVGRPGSVANVSRTVAIDMTDNMRYTPSQVRVKAGETIRFQVRNSGKIRHEFVLGSDADLQEHYQMMLQQPGMRHVEPNSVSLEPGKGGEVIWRFDSAGTVAFGCLEPGHYPAGMKGAVSVQ